jgi:FkbH-like protein
VNASLYTNFAWLPAAPDNFTELCRSLAAEECPGQGFEALAKHALDEGQLDRLGRAVTSVAAKGRSLAPLAPIRLAILGNSTLDLLVPMLVASAARHGLALECVLGSFGQMTQQALDPSSAVHTSKPDAVLLALDHRGLALRFVPGDGEAEKDAITSSIAQLSAIRDAIHINAGAVCVVQTVPVPPEALFGSLDHRLAGSPRRTIEALNRVIGDSISGTSDLLLDVAGLAETVGLATWHSPTLWNLAKLPCDVSCMPIYAEHVARLLAAMRGRSRKCLVLDLDNTVWGGVIGDDGVEGIITSPGEATGEAFLSLQEYVLSLRARGIVLAVSSKNSDDVARTPFREHPDMLLKEEHFAVFQANWNDKATNIKAIANELALGLDAMVLLDDNAVERALVRQILPQVAVPELPEDPALFARTLAAAGYFEAIAFSDEDRKRAEMYQSNARRVALQNQVGDVEEYLASLEMEIYFSPFDLKNLARITQLINKTNQFNLTTRRYSQAEVAAAHEDSKVFTLQVRLVDRFGDNGMISVVICRPGRSGTWSIDTWLMSCRVLGRRVEQMVLRELVQQGRLAGIETLVGTYIPTQKNGLVRDHYRKLGFKELAAREDGATLWSLPTSAEVGPVNMRVRRSGFAEAVLS